MTVKKNIQISPFFNLFEFLYSDTAFRNDILEEQYKITQEVLKNIESLVINILQPCREKIGLPIKINSGYRSKKLNELIGGSKTSYHLSGKAADITCANNFVLYKMIKEIDFKQLIWYEEGDCYPLFLHVSFDITNNKKEVLIYKDKKYTKIT